MVALETKQYPDLVDIAWLTKCFPTPRDTLSRQLELFNICRTGKNLYDPNIVVLFLKNKIKHKPGRKR